MSDDKRPRPWLDLKSGRPTPSPRLDPSQLGKPKGEAAPRPAALGKDKSAGAVGVFSHLLAGIIGGGAVAGVVYLATTGIVPGISFSTPDVREELRQLEERTAAL